MEVGCFGCRKTVESPESHTICLCKECADRFENNGWIDMNTTRPPLSLPMNTVWFLVVFHGECVVARNVVGKIQIQGSNSDFSDEIRYWQPLPKVI